MLKIDRKRIVIYTAATGLLIFLYSIGMFGPVEGIITRGLNPISSRIYTISSSVRTTYNEQASKQELLSEISSLRKQVNSLIEENAKFTTLDEENKSLREHLGFLTKSEYKYIIANVISRGDITDQSGRTETITINKGTRDGVYTGLGIVSSRGVIVGKIVGAKENISKVYLTNNNKCKLAATVFNDEKTSGIAEGELGLTISMGFIPQDKEVGTNDIVVTSGLEQLIPRGLVIGRVIEVVKESNELWQTATIEPLNDPEDLVIVSVLIP